MKIIKTDEYIELRNGSERVRISAWGEGIRVRAVPGGEFPQDDRALINPAAPHAVTGDDFVENGGLVCRVKDGHISFSKDGEILLEEMTYPWSLRESARAYKYHLGAEGFKASLRFKSYEGEKLHGMGQYRDARYDLKGCNLELAQRNSQITVPFLLSSRGYGFLWNDPCVAHAVFAQNKTEWNAECTLCVDYWVCAGSPREMVEKYMAVTGLPSELPESLLGLWQCKLRYRTQDEVLEVAREYHRRGIPLDVIVIDFFHWDYQGDWCFDRKYWPDVPAMVKELESYGTKLMVSVWPTVDDKSVNFKEFSDNGYLVRTDRGLNYVYNWPDAQHMYDATNPEARKFAFSLLQKNYIDDGIELFWLDQAEPELGLFHYDNIRYHLGSGDRVGNIYPREHARMVYEGMKNAGKKDILSLLRCAWVGSARYGALVWSGDIESSFREMKVQIANGINMGIAGIPWWICDTAGFYGGNVNDPELKELLVRWFQWAVYLPVLRMHGDRMPDMPVITQGETHGGGFMRSGAPNEMWSYGEEVFAILERYTRVRLEMKPYIAEIAKETEQTGVPMIRALFLEFPEDEECWNVSDEYMFGPDLLVAPVTDYGARERSVYLPKGIWQPMDGSDEITSEGQYVTAKAPLEYMPVFMRVE